MNVDDDLEDIRCIRGPGGERLPTASYALLPNLKKGLFFAIGEGLRIFVVYFLHTREHIFLYQTPGRRPPRITGRVANTVTRRRVGAPNEHTLFRIHEAVVGFVDRCLSWTPLRIKHLAEFFSGQSWPKICPGNAFFGLFGKFGTLFLKVCAHSERYRNIMAVIFEIQSFF